VRGGCGGLWDLGSEIDEREEVKRLYMQFGMTKLDVGIVQSRGLGFVL
jgi:hypothetical protein